MEKSKDKQNAKQKLKTQNINLEADQIVGIIWTLIIMRVNSRWKQNDLSSTKPEQNKYDL